MSGRILIVECIATNRIMLRATLQAAHYDVRPCATVAEARQALLHDEVDIVLIDTRAEPVAALAFCTAIKADPARAAVRVIALTPTADRAARIAALRAGADDVLDKAAQDQLLLACIRSLLRARNAASDLTLREDADKAPGFAETAEGFAGAGRVALVTARPDALPPVLRMLMDRLPGPAHLVSPGHDLTDPVLGPLADLYIIDGADLRTDATQPADLFRIVADLRSRSATHHAATLVMLPQTAQDLAAMALDLGAHDQVSDAICADELAHRVRSLMRRKLRADRQRDQVQYQLQAANLDPLTGLYNRRHANRRLERMADIARMSGQEFAVMVLDIDHFKSINDTYGHPAGDRVLIEVSRRLRDNLRAIDLIARIGGEEFLVAMPDTTAEQAQGAAERLRRVIDGALFETAAVSRKPDSCKTDSGKTDSGKTDSSKNDPCKTGPRTKAAGTAGIRVTLSIGVAVGPGETPPGLGTDTMIAGLFERADRALYAAKSAGRNMVTVSRSVAQSAA